MPPSTPNQGQQPQSISLHNRTYALPTRPTVVICVDGFDTEYLAQGTADGITPNLSRCAAAGFHATASAAMPSFTNPNNVSIITGAPTSVHGIAGNYFLDRATGKETMIVDDSLLRGTTILAEAAAAGVRVAAVTAKDKLRRILQHGLDGTSTSTGVEEAKPTSQDSDSNGNGNSICFSAERASDETLTWLGRPSRPSQYSADLSLFVLDAGVELLQERRADLLYLTLSDFVQHKHAPGSPEANDFMAGIDTRIGAMANLGAVIAVTGDHGMSDKTNADGAPNVLFLQDRLEARFGPGCARVICPITDPFVKHHGALGSFVRVYVADSHLPLVGDMISFCRGFPQVEVALGKVEGAGRCETPVDIEGDLVVVAAGDAVIGSRACEHDLSSLGGHRLRSHGGFSEQEVPLLMSVPAGGDVSAPSGGGAWRNFDVFDLVLNHGQ